MPDFHCHNLPLWGLLFGNKRQKATLKRNPVLALIGTDLAILGIASVPFVCPALTAIPILRGGQNICPRCLLAFSGVGVAPL
jgi:hypothetical protein